MIRVNPKICSPATLATVKEFLEGVVLRGTAKNIKNNLYPIAGKTGTAQIADNNLGYDNGGRKIYQSSFVGYFPAHKPQYSIIVVISSPSNGAYYGASIIVRCLKKFRTRYIPVLPPSAITHPLSKIKCQEACHWFLRQTRIT